MINVKFYSPNGLVKEGLYNHVQVNHNTGSFGILENHVPIISIVEKGYIELDNDNHEYIAVSGAIFKFQNNEAVIICEYLKDGINGEDSVLNLDKELASRKDENRARNIELALAENELKKQIKKTGAGNL